MTIMNYGNLEECQSPWCTNVSLHLDLLKGIEAIDGGRISHGKALDWGAGHGSSTQALKNHSDDVEAVEKLEAAKIIVERSILPAERVYVEDGIEFLKRNPKRYDFIMASLLGPVYNAGIGRHLHTLFYDAAMIGLKPQGNVLITTDVQSFRYVERELAKGRVEKSWSGFLPAWIGRKD